MGGLGKQNHWKSMHFLHYHNRRDMKSNYSYRKSLKTIGKSSVSVGWAKSGNTIPRMSKLWNDMGPFKTIGETSGYTRSQRIFTFHVFCYQTPDCSYRKPLEIIGESNVSVGRQKAINTLENSGGSNVPGGRQKQ